MEIVLDADSINALIGIGAAPALVIGLTSHMKRFARALAGFVARLRRTPGVVDQSDASPWPLVSDAVAVAWAFALWSSGMIPGGDALAWPAVVLLGVALGLGAGKLRDAAT